MSEDDFNFPEFKIPYHTAEELTVNFRCLVESVTYKSVGGLEIKIKHDATKADHDVVERLWFPGPIPIFSGDLLAVYILKSHRVALLKDDDFDGRIYAKRDLKSSESPLKIVKILPGEHERELATYINSKVLDQVC